jgi:hypothetical protein
VRAFPVLATDNLDQPGDSLAPRPPENSTLDHAASEGRKVPLRERAARPLGLLGKTLREID